MFEKQFLLLWWSVYLRLKGHPVLIFKLPQVIRKLSKAACNWLLCCLICEQFLSMMWSNKLSVHRSSGDATAYLQHLLNGVFSSMVVNSILLDRIKLTARSLSELAAIGKHLLAQEYSNALCTCKPPLMHPFSQTSHIGLRSLVSRLLVILGFPFPLSFELLV